ncbi:methyl-accepting chemotaxis protein [Thiohalorhabdus sp. Cl-TMA]|uniref:Methyl-accepting chemotaxis protein n=2 Tax=Thiohalorhabdus methylotrophus TaxID=3242694 RepID=A0ABV4TUT0_9GAMM
MASMLPGILVGLVLGWLMAGVLWGVRRWRGDNLSVLRERVETAGEGDLTVQIPEDGRGEQGKLAGAFRDMLASLRSVFHDWRSQTATLINTGEQLSASAWEIGKSAQNSSSRVEEVGHSAKEVNQVVQDVANNINEVSKSASEATSSMQSGIESVEKASQQINQLKTAGERVDEIMGLIQSIAKKTDLLALNAAIEAANAGEAGHGFAVVADEVRKLAEQTSEATQSVNEVVEEVRTRSNESVQAMKEVQDQMGQVLTTIEHTDQSANQIASAAEELSATMSETTENIGEVQSNVEVVADKVTFIEDAAQQLNEMAFGLQNGLAKFMLEEGESDENVTWVDFELEKSSHHAWKTRLRNLLQARNSLSEQEAPDTHECRLGIWLANEGMPNYGSDATIQQFNRDHKALHDEIKQVIRLNNSGRSQEAWQHYNQFEDTCDRMLKTMESLTG